MKLWFLVWGPWLLMQLYISFVVRQKDIRVFLFLFVFLFVFFPLSIDRAIKPRQKWIEYLITVLIAINTFIAISLTFPKNLHSFLSMKPNLSQRKLISGEFSNHPLTYEEAKIDDIFQLVRADCLKRKNCSSSFPSVFLPHASRINSSVFTDYSLFVRKDSKPISEWTPSWKIQSGLFRFGGWFFSGGIPASFFNSNYIVFYSSISEFQLAEDGELYNRVFHEQLTKKTPFFLDGLEEIAKLDSALGPIHILRRDHIPSATSFIKIVDLFQNIDPDNWWNHPFLDAVDKLQKNSSVPRITHLERLKAKEPTPEYTKAWNFPSPGNYSYPDLLNKINLNP
jgi:hypothetical protein